ncbi:MAG: hypothetical protein AAF333_01020 [Planctomycetota bacterium]
MLPTCLAMAALGCHLSGCCYSVDSIAPGCILQANYFNGHTLRRDPVQLYQACSALLMQGLFVSIYRQYGATLKSCAGMVAIISLDRLVFIYFRFGTQAIESSPHGFLYHPGVFLVTGIIATVIIWKTKEVQPHHSTVRIGQYSYPIWSCSAILLLGILTLATPVALQATERPHTAAVTLSCYPGHHTQSETSSHRLWPLIANYHEFSGAWPTKTEQWLLAKLYFEDRQGNATAYYDSWPYTYAHPYGGSRIKVLLQAYTATGKITYLQSAADYAQDWLQTIPEDRHTKLLWEENFTALMWRTLVWSDLVSQLQRTDYPTQQLEELKKRLRLYTRYLSSVRHTASPRDQYLVACAQTVAIVTATSPTTEQLSNSLADIARTYNSFRANGDTDEASQYFGKRTLAILLSYQDTWASDLDQPWRECVTLLDATFDSE